jgi:hypothetical protein
MTQPPWVNPFLGSSSGPPGDCMTPSSVTWVIAIVFLSPVSIFRIQRTNELVVLTTRVRNFSSLRFMLTDMSVRIEM